MKYKDYNDFELLSYIKEQNEEANEIIYEKYRPLIIKIAKKINSSLINTGIDMNDLISEGMLGLSKAINTYDETTNTLFYTYAKTCIESYMMTLIKKGYRLKNRYLSESISYDSEENNTLKTFKDNSVNPENIIIRMEDEKNIYSMAKKILTPYEYIVFEKKLEGFDYKEIAKILGKSSKDIDNALARIKKKLKKVNNH